MCAIIEDRIRINKIMSHTLSMRLDNRPANLGELARLCVVALQLYYDGACPEECLEARARDFAAWHLARLGDVLSRSTGMMASIPAIPPFAL
jgi:hypothetical protein